MASFSQAASARNCQGSTHINFADQVLPLGAKTVSFWFFANSTGTFSGLVANNGGATLSHGTQFMLQGNRIVDFASTRNVSPLRFRATSVTVIDEQRWYHQIGLWDGTTNANQAKNFLDGTLESQATANQTGSGIPNSHVGIPTLQKPGQQGGSGAKRRGQFP